MMEQFEINTPRRDAMVDITSEVERLVRSSGIDDGLVTVCCPHTSG